MGTMKFLLPSNLSAEAVQELERTSVAGGQDDMPFPTDVSVEPGAMTVVRSLDESGFLLAPWQVNGSGLVMARSATLMERPRPYHLLIELARGKMNQVRGQAAEWVMGGLEITPAVDRQIKQATHAFAQAVIGEADLSQAAASSSGGLPAEDRLSLADLSQAVISAAQSALAEGYQAADRLVEAYVAQVFQLRQQRQPRLDTVLACRLGTTPPPAVAAAALTQTFNAVALPMSWNRIEPSEGDYRWDWVDNLLTWAQATGLPVMGGPLVDFSGPSLPDWLWKRDLDLASQAAYMCDFAETVLHRYRERIQTWHLASACNYSQVLGRHEDELIWLTLRLMETARQVDAGIELIAGLAQPWGEYLVAQERCNSPFVFADTLIRSGIKLSGLDLEIVMAVWPRGSYCRDLLEASRRLDLYALLGLPLHVTLGYPSASGPDPLADADLKLTGGRWHDGFSPQVQADWTAAFAALALCKPYVRGVHWAHWSDGEPHLFPHCGLVDAQGNIKPALEPLQRLRQEHLC